ncbi:MAG TPA: right-handed parallel beta-helix repeat-containing protein, partial [Thermoplasmata archaeon]|nr:right-handed parallel beta-helix repeat-containing protein [Thermoplasmata archaeon]
MSMDKRKGFVGGTFLGNHHTRKADEESKDSRKITIFFAFLVMVMILTSLSLSITGLTPAVEESPASTSYLPRGNITIVGDLGFTLLNGVSSGTGIAGDPYIIDGWSINASLGDAISIAGTRAYFEVRNCYLYNGTTNADGVIMTNVENGTVKNNIIQNNSYGIHLDASHWNRLFLNNVSMNKLDGIYLDNCHNDTIDNNTCWNNLWDGVFLSI